MTSIAYTPGVWSLEHNNVRDEYHVFVNGHDLAECDTIAVAYTAANARLITAAPKLLAALKYALEFLEANDDGDEDVISRIAAATAAIAEATSSHDGGCP
jgi:hypothetical protein